ncbi:MAG: hypothetical protein FJ403_10210 [Verrucomicrobia bacterium]|nr:hypothetical protein [Verrucomicrobiota bacterium]
MFWSDQNGNPKWQLQIENHLECWKQFNHYLNTARTKEFDAEAENQFLEVKSLIIQELEMILASIECSSPTKEEIHALISGAHSIRYLSEMNDGGLRTLENQWHKIYIAWQSLLGQLKMQQRNLDGQSAWSSLFGRKK